MLELKSFGKLRSLTGIEQKKFETLSFDIDRQYKSFDSQIGGAKWRHIDNPKPDLKSAQTSVLRQVLSQVTLPQHMYGAKKGASIIQHAQRHAGEECVLTLDLKDCYPRTSNEQVHRVFMQRLGCSPQIANVLTKLCTLNFRLPQGAPTSGYLAHLALLDLFRDLTIITRRHGLKLSFYVDDIAISGARPAVKGVIDEVLATIRTHDHSVRNKKKLIMVGDERTITGLDVRYRLQVPRAYIDELEASLITAARLGTVPRTKFNSLRGQIQWVQQVDAGQAAPLQELFAFVDAGSRETKTFPRNVPCNGKATCLWWKQNQAQYAR